ncbi:MAG TPA: hypothetical protein VGM92_05065 [Candidatus Kapabacteria bacterium]
MASFLYAFPGMESTGLIVAIAIVVVVALWFALSRGARKADVHTSSKNGIDKSRARAEFSKRGH